MIPILPETMHADIYIKEPSAAVSVYSGHLNSLLLSIERFLLCTLS
jgi:hypothetical protein